ncbi:MAG: ATP-binding protein [Candidatus Dojkabacteria bacterium]
MDFHSLVLLCITGFLFTLSFLVFWRKDKAPGKFYLASAMFLSGIWTASSIINHLSFDKEVVEFFTRLSYSVSLLSMQFLVLFSFKYNDLFNNEKRSVMLFTIVYIGLAVLIHATDTIIVEAVLRSEKGSESAVFGQWFALYGAIALSYLFIVAANFIRGYIHSKGIHREQLKYIFIGLSISLTLGILVGFVFQLLGNQNLHYLAPFTPIFAIIGIYYSIFRYRFLSLQLLMRKSIIILALALTLYASFYTIYLIESELFGGVFTEKALLYGIIIALLFAYLFKELFEQINLRFINPELDYEHASLEFNKRVGDTFDKTDIVSLFDEILRKKIRYTKIVCVSFRNRNEVVTPTVIYSSPGESQHSFIHDLPIEILKDELVIKQEGVLITEELWMNQEANNSYAFKQFLSYLDEYRIALSAPILFKQKILGYIFIGSKISGSGYSIQDINLIENMMLSLTYALQRSILYDEIMNFASNLQDKVNAVTKELQEKYQQERDMMGIMGHELRTPISISKGMLELLISKLRNSSSIEKEYILDKSEKAFNSIIKESELIETMLSTSHVDNHKVDLQMTEINLEEIVDYAIAAHKKDADLKGLEVSYIKPDKPVPLIVSDRNRVLEVINNLVSNAVKYTHTGHVHVFLKPAKQHVSLVVKDTGIGIPKEAMHKLGRKFYRVDQYVDNEGFVVRPGGTGLGLYVVKGILEVLGGDLKIKSKLGKGSVFTAVFPIGSKRTPQVITNEDVADDDENIDMFEKLGLKK